MRLHLIMWTFAAGILAMPAVAQQFPANTVRIIVPNAPGGGNDFVGRVAAQQLEKRFKQPFVVENHGGGGGAIGLANLRRSAPDGHTIATVSDGPLIINPAINPGVSYKSKDFVPVALLTEHPVVLVVNPKVKARTVTELIALAKTQEGGLAFASGGVGNFSHLAAELFATMAGVTMVHSPYSGTAPSTSAVLSGEVDMAFLPTSNALGHIRSGKLIALGVGADKTVDDLPEVPPIAATLPGFQSGVWVGVIAPAGVPQDRIDLIGNTLVDIFKSNEVVQQMKKAGIIPAPLASEQFAAYLAKEEEKLLAIIRKADIKIR